MANNKFIECIHVDNRGRHSLRVAPDCSTLERGITVSIVWELVFPEFTESQLDTIYAITWKHQLIRYGDAFKAGCYSTLKLALQRAGFTADEAKALGTQTINMLRKEWN